MIKYKPTNKQLNDYIKDIEKKLTEFWVAYQLAEKQSKIILTNSNIDWNKFKKEIEVQIYGLEDKIFFIKSLL